MNQKTGRIIFAFTPEELIAVWKEVSEMQPMELVLHSDVPEYATYQRFTSLEDYGGTSKVERLYQGYPQFYVVPAGSAIPERVVQLRKGGEWTVLDPPEGPWFTFTPCAYALDDLLIMGTSATLTAPENMSFFNNFRKALKRASSCLNGFWLSPKVIEFINAGGRISAMGMRSGIFYGFEWLEGALESKQEKQSRNP